LYEFVLNLLEESRYALRLDGREGDPVYCRSLLGVHSRYGLHTRAVTNS
jgi:hypothetical protein